MESIILKVCIIYLIICFIFFVCSEIISMLEAKKRNVNAIYTFQRFKVNHFKIVIKSIFFPITILMGILDAVSESMFRKEVRSNWRKK